jgi:putative acetyltransferase
MRLPMIRRAIPQDIGAVARLFRVVRRSCLPFLPDLHTAADDLAFFGQHVFRDCEVWVAGADVIEGFCAFRAGWVDHLYVDPDRHGQGLGSALLGKAMAKNARLRLWVFQRNAAAIRFYAARGFRRIDATDGHGNEEREPDALLEWTRPAR